MGLKSRMKGKLGEREAAKFLRELGFTTARRSQQYCGGESSSDVMCDECPNVHIEVKYGYPIAKFNVGNSLHDAACDQALNDSQGRPWIVLWKPKGNRLWLATTAIETEFGPILCTIRHSEIGWMIRNLNDRAKL